MVAHKKPREARRCLECNKEFDTLVSSSRKWCSRKCYHPRKSLNGRFGKTIVPWNKGVKYAPEFKKKHKFGAPKGTKNRLGSKWTMEQRIRKSMTLIPRPEFDGFVSVKNRRERLRFINFQFRKKVLERDSHQCVRCGAIENLHVHHIKSWKDYPDLRTEESNGETLCAACHRNVHRRERIV